MGTVYAYSFIRRLNARGEVEEFAPGDKLEGFSKEEIAHFLERGSAATYDVTKSQAEQAQADQDENAKLREKVADLEAKLAEATKAQTSTSSTSTSSGASAPKQGSGSSK